MACEWEGGRCHNCEDAQPKIMNGCKVKRCRKKRLHGVWSIHVGALYCWHGGRVRCGAGRTLRDGGVWQLLAPGASLPAFSTLRDPSSNEFGFTVVSKQSSMAFLSEEDNQGIERDYLPYVC